MDTASRTEFTILIVCSGNICRSPMAERLLRLALGAASARVRIGSAGTVADSGRGMTAEAAAVLAGYGATPDGHSSRPLSRELVDEAGLILSATRQHRSAVVSLSPSALRRAFTMRQFARLLESLTPDDVRGMTDLSELVAAAADQRGHLLPLNRPDDDDIPDPYLRDRSAYDEAGRLIAHDVGIIAEKFLQIAWIAE